MWYVRKLKMFMCKKVATTRHAIRLHLEKRIFMRCAVLEIFQVLSGKGGKVCSNFMPVLGQKQPTYLVSPSITWKKKESSKQFAELGCTVWSTVGDHLNYSVTWCNTSKSFLLHKSYHSSWASWYHRGSRAIDHPLCMHCSLWDLLPHPPSTLRTYCPLEDPKIFGCLLKPGDHFRRFLELVGSKVIVPLFSSWLPGDPVRHGSGSTARRH